MDFTKPAEPIDFTKCAYVSYIATLKKKRLEAAKKLGTPKVTVGVFVEEDSSEFKRYFDIVEEKEKFATDFISVRADEVNSVLNFTGIRRD